MPLLRKKGVAWALVEPLKNLDPREEVFVVRATQEVFRDYQSFLDRQQLYEEEVWACRYSGHGGMTYEAAAEEEAKAVAALAKFPKELEEQVVRAIHHSLLPTDQLVSSIYESLRPAPKAGAAKDAAAAGGQADGAQQEQASEGPSPLATKENEGPPQQQQQAAAADAEAATARKGEPAAAGGEAGEAGAAAAAAVDSARAELTAVKPGEGGGPGPSTTKKRGPKAPVSRPLLRTFLIENAAQEGPEHATKQVWVVNQELRARYGLPEELPAEVAAALQASVKTPKPKKAKKDTGEDVAEGKEKKEGGEGEQPKEEKDKAPEGSAMPKLPPKPKPKKKKVEGAAASQGAGTESAEGAAQKQQEEAGEEEKKEKKEEVPKVCKDPTPLEELEKHFRPGTAKRYAFETLRAVAPEALTVSQLLDKCRELGIHEFDAEKQAKTVAQVLSTDPHFVRVSRGAYSLHCFHPEIEVWVKAPAPKKRKHEEEGAGGEAPGSEPPAAEEEEEGGDPVARAERLVTATEAALRRHRAALEVAQKAAEAAKAKLAEEKKKFKSPAKVRESDIHIPAERVAEFELKPDEREFQGEADDRKGLMEHRQRLQSRVKELEAAKKAYIAAELTKREKAAAAVLAPLRPLEGEARRADRELAHCRRNVESAEKAAAAAEKKLEKAKGHVEKHKQRAKEREEREKAKAAEREERERRRAEAAKAKEEAKRYPIEDLELLEEQAAGGGARPDVALPAWLEPEEAQRVSSSLFVSDFLQQFGRNLKLPGLSYESFEAALADAVSTAVAPAAGGRDDARPAAQLHAVYQQMLALMLEDARERDEATAQEKRWQAVLSDGTWAEVLRRMVLTRAHAGAEDDEQPWRRADEPAALAASMLAFDAADRLTHDQHLALLRHLTAEVLDTDRMRAIIHRREDEAQDVKRDVRGELAEERKRLKELQDEEREQKRRRREEAVRKAEEEARAKEAASGEGAVAAAGSKAGSPAPGGAECGAGGAAPMEEDAPSFELPERLREYQGDPDDTKARMQWRQEAQAERKRLDKERNKWVAEQLRRQRELEAEERAARKAAEEKQRVKDAAREAIVKAQEELEEKLEKYSVRRVVLGQDRHFRRYWWGLGGHRPAVFVEDEEGRWASLGSLAEVDSLLASLDRRGHRELALAEALEKQHDSLAWAFQRAEKERAKAAEREAKQQQERPQALRTSGRDRQQVQFFNPSAASGAGGKPAPAAAKAGSPPPSAAGLAGLFGPAEAAAAAGAAAELLEVHREAERAGVDAPEGGWKQWAAGVKAAAAGAPLEAAGAGGRARGSAAAVRAALRDALLSLEAALLAAAAEQPEEAEEEEEEEEERSEGEEEESEGPPGSADSKRGGGMSRTQSAHHIVEVVDELFSPTKAAAEGAAYLWKTAPERAAWLADAGSAATAARLAYAAAVLGVQAQPLLLGIRQAKAAAKVSKQLQGKASAAAAKKGGDGKLSRAPSNAALDAGKPGKAAGGKRKAAAPPADGGRVTRARS